MILTWTPCGEWNENRLVEEGREARRVWSAAHVAPRQLWKNMIRMTPSHTNKSVMIRTVFCSHASRGWLLWPSAGDGADGGCLGPDRVVMAGTNGMEDGEKGGETEGGEDEGGEKDGGEKEGGGRNSDA